MKPVIPISYVVYFVTSKHEWFKQVAYPVLPNAYHLFLFRYYPVEQNVQVMTSKSNNKTYIIPQVELEKRVESIFTYVLYNN